MNAATSDRVAFFVDGFNLYHTAVLVTGDTDLKPVVRTFRKLHAAKRILFAFPYDRKNSELAAVAPGSFSISAESYSSHQLAHRIQLPSKKHVYMPKVWGTGQLQESPQ